MQLHWMKLNKWNGIFESEGTECDHICALVPKASGFELRSRGGQHAACWRGQSPGGMLRYRWCGLLGFWWLDGVDTRKCQCESSICWSFPRCYITAVDSEHKKREPPRRIRDGWRRRVRGQPVRCRHSFASCRAIIERKYQLSVPLTKIVIIFGWVQFPFLSRSQVGQWWQTLMRRAFV